MKETQQSICAWAEETFGPVTNPLKLVSRAQQEMAELAEAVQHDDRAEIGKEAADVIILLYRLLEHHGLDLPQEVEDKMASTAAGSGFRPATGPANTAPNHRPDHRRDKPQRETDNERAIRLTCSDRLRTPRVLLKKSGTNHPQVPSFKCGNRKRCDAPAWLDIISKKNYPHLAEGNNRGAIAMPYLCCRRPALRVFP